MNKILLIGCDKTVGKLITAYFERQEYTVTTCATSNQAKEIIKYNNFDILVVDISHGGASEIKSMRKQHPTQEMLPVIILTESNKVDIVINSMKSSKIDYITKPFKLIKLLGLIRKALSTNNHTASQKAHFGSIIGSSPEILHICSLIERVSTTDATVLIQGESGTGKELVARAIHDSSHRSNNKFK